MAWATHVWVMNQLYWSSCLVCRPLSFLSDTCTKCYTPQLRVIMDLCMLQPFHLSRHVIISLLMPTTITRSDSPGPYIYHRTSVGFRLLINLPTDLPAKLTGVFHL